MPMDPHLQSAFDAVEANDAAKLSQVLKSIPEAETLHASRDDGYSLATLAAIKGHLLPLGALKGRGVDFTRSDAKGDTPLTIAARSASGLPALRVIASWTRGRIDDVPPAGNSALHIAAEGGKVDALNILFDAGASPRTRNREGRTPLHCAVLSDSDTSCAALCTILDRAKCEGIDDADGRGATALHMAIDEHHPDKMHLLIEAGACLTAMTTDTRDSPLHRAAFLGDSEAVQALLENEAPVDAENRYHETPLAIVAQEWDPSLPNSPNHAIAVRLCARGADPLHQDLSGLTPLHVAALKSEEKLLCTLLGRVPPGISLPPDLVTLAGRKRQVGAMERMINHGADLTEFIGDSLTRDLALAVARREMGTSRALGDSRFAEELFYCSATGRPYAMSGPDRPVRVPETVALTVSQADAEPMHVTVREGQLICAAAMEYILRSAMNPEEADARMATRACRDGDSQRLAELGAVTRVYLEGGGIAQRPQRVRLSVAAVSDCQYVRVAARHTLHGLRHPRDSPGSPHSPRTPPSSSSVSSPAL